MGPLNEPQPGKWDPKKVCRFIAKVNANLEKSAKMNTQNSALSSKNMG